MLVSMHCISLQLTFLLTDRIKSAAVKAGGGGVLAGAVFVE